MNKLLICLALFFSSSLFLLAQQKKIDSVEALLKTDKEDTNKVKHLYTLCGFYALSGENDKSLKDGNSALELAQKLDYQNGVGSSYLNLVSLYYEEDQYNKALDYAIKTLTVFKKTGNKALLAKAYTNIGGLYIIQVNYPKAIEYLLEGLNVSGSIGDSLTIGKAMGNIANCYMNENDFNNALLYAQSAAKIFERLGEKEIMARSYIILGLAYEHKRDYKNALSYLRLTSEYSSQMGDKKIWQMSLMDMGDTYFSEGDYKNALLYYNKSLDIARANGFQDAIINNLQCIGTVYVAIKSYKQAEIYLLKSLTMSDSAKILTEEKDCYENLSELYARTNQWQKAYQYHLKYSKAKDSMFNADRSKEIGRLEAKFGYDKDSAIQQARFSNELAIQRAQIEKKTAESKTQKVIIWLIASVTGTLILLVVLIFQRMKGVEKKKLIAEQQKAWLELKALRTQMNPHFLYNTLNSIQNFVLKNDTKASSNYLSQFAGLMRSVLENSRKDKITLAEEIDGLSNYIDFEVMRFPKKFKYDIQVDASLDKAKTELPPLLIQPYVENAIWHGLMHLEERAGRLNILFEKVGYQLKCTVDDNGIGRQAATALKKQSVHKSVGLSIVAERMESMNKMYHWEMKTEIIDKFNENGASDGTRAELFLPLIINAVAYA